MSVGMFATPFVSQRKTYTPVINGIIANVENALTFTNPPDPMSYIKGNGFAVLFVSQTIQFTNAGVQTLEIVLPDDINVILTTNTFLSTIGYLAVSSTDGPFEPCLLSAYAQSANFRRIEVARVNIPVALSHLVAGLYSNSSFPANTLYQVNGEITVPTR